MALKIKHTKVAYSVLVKSRVTASAKVIAGELSLAAAQALEVRSIFTRRATVIYSTVPTVSADAFNDNALEF